MSERLFRVSLKYKHETMFPERYKKKPYYVVAYNKEEAANFLWARIKPEYIVDYVIGGISDCGPMISTKVFGGQG